MRSLPGRAVGLCLAALSGLFGGLLGGCVFWQPTTVPMQQVLHAAPCRSAAGGAGTPQTLIVLLPGRYMALHELERHGFVAAVRRRGIDADVLLVNAHLGYYSERSVVGRLIDDVIEPARRRGVQHIWVAGISLGAFGAFMLAQERPGALDGIVALGPYLGEPEMARPITAAGGLRHWSGVAAGPAAADTLEGAVVRTWSWLRRQADIPVPSGVPPVYLGFGTEDRLATTQRLLADALPPERVRTRPGGHDWPAWEPLWDDWLDRLPLPRRGACVDAQAGSAVAPSR